MQITPDSTVCDLLNDLQERGVGTSVVMITDEHGDFIAYLFTINKEPIAVAMLEALSSINTNALPTENRAPNTH